MAWVINGSVVSQNETGKVVYEEVLVSHCLRCPYGLSALTAWPVLNHEKSMGIFVWGIADCRTFGLGWAFPILLSKEIGPVY